MRDGRTVTSDGPFAEIKEYVAGFYPVECDSHERAIEIAAKAPDAQRRHIEVRPVCDIRAMDQGDLGSIMGLRQLRFPAQGLRSSRLVSPEHQQHSIGPRRQPAVRATVYCGIDLIH